MKKKEIKGIKKKLIVSVKKALNANNKSLIATLEKDLKNAVKVVETKKAKKRVTMKQPATVEA
jgi:hypothetical protein